MIYITFTKTQLNQNSVTQAKKSGDGLILSTILSKIPQLGDKYIQLIIHRQCDRCQSRFRFLASENLLTQDMMINKCILFLVF